ncbi:MAG: ATP-binding protein [Deferrisomatales bacterium]
MSPRFGITAKFTVLASGLVVLSALTWGGFAWQRERALMLAHTEREGRLLVSAMAIPIINALLYEEIGVIEEGGLLDNFVAEIMAHEALEPLYAVVLDPGGRVLAHNAFAEYGQVYGDPLTRRALAAREFLLQDSQVEGVAAWDLAHPLAIHGKRWGVLRVGISLRPLQEQLRALATRITFFAGGFLATGVLVFYLLGRALARPLLALARRMESVGSALPDLPAPALRRDEIGDLERSFRDMLARLLASEAEQERATRHLLENQRLVTAGQIVAGVAHEVNNPLAAMDTALFQAERAPEAERARYLRVVRQGMERIRTVVAQLLDLSRSGAVRRQAEPVAKLFQEAALFAKMALKRKTVRLEVAGPPPGAQLCVDRNKVQQALLNLVLNAADAAGESGTVHLSAALEGGAVVFAVEDDGPGVPEELRERIFEPFFTTKPPGQGSGMGLAISRRIAEGHGGSLTAEAGQGGGARFVLRLPTGPVGKECCP